jgi:hypothetical protein
MMPSATVKGPDVELVMTDTLRPIMPTSLTPKSNLCGSCSMGSALDSSEKEYNGLSRDGCGAAEMSPSRLHHVSGDYQQRCTYTH